LTEVGLTERNRTTTKNEGRTEVTPAAPAAIQDPELEQVERWRAERLKRAGYPSDGAVALAARHDVDLHRAIELLESGCPAEIALKILL
jgi:hypothetical protein